MAKGTSLIVLDLRNNYGGVIQDAMLDASLFLGKYTRTYALSAMMKSVTFVQHGCDREIQISLSSDNPFDTFKRSERKKNNNLSTNKLFIR